MIKVLLLVRVSARIVAQVVDDARSAVWGRSLKLFDYSGGASQHRIVRGVVDVPVPLHRSILLW